MNPYLSLAKRPRLVGVTSSEMGTGLLATIVGAVGATLGALAFPKHTILGLLLGGTLGAGGTMLIMSNKKGTPA